MKIIYIYRPDSGWGGPRSYIRNEMADERQFAIP